jgi:hypothetical protein
VARRILRPSFSLRNLFIAISIIAVWLAYEFNWIRQRQVAIAWATSQAERWAGVPVSQRVHFGARAPWPIRMLGEAGVEQISVVVEKQEVAVKQRELERLFPEANVVVMTPGPGYIGKHAAR